MTRWEARRLRPALPPPAQKESVPRRKFVQNATSAGTPDAASLTQCEALVSAAERIQYHHSREALAIPGLFVRAPCLRPVCLFVPFLSSPFPVSLFFDFIHATLSRLPYLPLRIHTRVTGGNFSNSINPKRSQRRHVGELEPELYFLGVGG